MSRFDSPFDWYACGACGRGAVSVEGHDPLVFCYGCGARFIEQHKGPDDFSKHCTGFEKAEEFGPVWVEFPGDVRYDPWTGVPLPGSPRNPAGRTMREHQLTQLAALGAK